MQGYIMENACSIQIFGLSYTSILTLDTSYVYNSCKYKMIKSDIHQHKFYLLEKHSQFQKFWNIDEERDQNVYHSLG